MDWASVKEAITVFGWPGAILIVLAVAAWRIGKPALNRVVDAHVKFVDVGTSSIVRTESLVEMQTRNNDSMTVAIARLSSALEDMSRQSLERDRRITEMLERVAGIIEREAEMSRGRWDAMQLQLAELRNRSHP